MPGVERLGCHVKRADIQQPFAHNADTETVLVGKLRPAHVGLVARFLRTDIGIILVCDLAAIDTYER